MLSLHAGYDTAYLTDAVGTGAAATDYYTAAKGEPPGYWQGRGAAALGLEGQVDAGMMRQLYHEDVGPDGQVLVRRQQPGKYPAAGGSLYERIDAAVAAQVAALGRFAQPEEIRAIQVKERAKFRNRVPFYDYTFSAPKSVSVLWASLLAAAAEAEATGDEAEAERLAERAAQVRGAVKRANDRMMAVAERDAAYVRTGHHSATSGEYRDAEGFIIGSFEQSDARDGMPQLHVHNAIANRARRLDEADGKWRALHGQPLFKERLGFAALADRFLAQELELLGWRTVVREDGTALEVGGISDEAADAFSTRAKELRDKARELAHNYQQKHGHAPGKAAWYRIRQQAALKTRASKDHNPPAAGQRLQAWGRQAERSGAGKLASLHEAAAAYAAEHEPSGLPGGAERRSIIRQAVAAVQTANSSWTRSQLLFELGHALPALPAGVDPEVYLNGLADEALSGRAEGVNTIQIAPVPDVIDVARLGLRKDGTSIYRPPGEERFVTAGHLDLEQHLADVALLPVPQRVTAEAAAAAVAGTDLDYSQREACLGLLTSTRLVNCLVAPAGTGKTHVVAAFARIWAAETGGRVIGLTASTNAARVMADEAKKAGAPMITRNIAQFLGKIKGSDRTRGHMEVYPGDVLVVDEASQVGTEDMGRIVQVARRCGAMVVGVGDTEQLEAVDAGGIFRLIAARHGHWKLTEVRRFTNAWERDASLRLRGGDVSVMAEYAARGRVYSGRRDRVYDEAVMLWVGDYMRGRESLLMATSNETAAVLARLARERLTELRQVSGENEITLSDGNAAGRGDWVRARLNTRIDADGQTLANRDVARLESWQDSAYGRLALMSRQVSPGQWSRPFLVPAAYLEQSAELAYAGNVHVAQGATVDAGHTVIEPGASRGLAYTGGTRGRAENTFHIVTGEPDPAQPDRAEREAYTDAAIRQRAELRAQGKPGAARAIPLAMPERPTDRQLAPWEAVMAQVLQQDQPERTALEEMQAAQDWSTNTAHLLELSEAYWRLDVVPEIDEMVRQRVSAREYERYRQDPERPALLQALREHEIGGRSIEDSLDAITAGPMAGLRSIAAGLHGRLGKGPPPARGETKTWVERAPRNAPEPVREAARMLDTRQAELGRQLAAQPPPWALDAWKVPPSAEESAALRADWELQAGIVGAYREAIGITDPGQAIGPPPTGQAQLSEAYQSAVRALRLPDNEALLRAMGSGELEAASAAGARAAASARPDVQAEVGERQLDFRYAADRADIALGAGDTEAAAEADAEAEGHAGELARLAVADAARREWIEANAGTLTAGRDAETELRRRGLADRVTAARAPARPEPAMTDAEFGRHLDQMVAEAEGREWVPPEPEAQAEPEPQAEALSEAEFQEQLDRMVAAAEGREYVPPAPGPDPDPDPEPEPEPLPEAEFQAQLDQIVAEAEGRQYVPTEPEPEPEAQPGREPDVETDDEFMARLDRMVAESEGREYVPMAPEPAAAAGEDKPQPGTDAEFRARPPQVVAEAEARHAAKPEPEPEPAPEPVAEPEPAADPGAGQLTGVHAEIGEDLQYIRQGIAELAAQGQAAAAARAEAEQEAMLRPAAWQQAEVQAQAEAEAAAEPSWQPEEAGDMDMEAEI